MLQKKLFPARPILPGYRSAGRFLIAVSLRENSTSKCALKPRDKLGVVTHICTPRTWEAEAGKVPQVRGHPRIRSSEYCNNNQYRAVSGAKTKETAQIVVPCQRLRTTGYNQIGKGG